MEWTTLCHGGWVESHNLLVQKFFQLLSADIILVHCRRTAFSWDMVNETMDVGSTDSQIQRIQGREVGRLARRRDRAVDRTIVMSGRTGIPEGVLYSRMPPDRGGRERPRQ